MKTKSGGLRFAFGGEALGLDVAVVAFVFEASADIKQGEWRSNVTRASVLDTVLGWIALGVTVVMAGSHECAGRYVSRLLYTVARRRW